MENLRKMFDRWRRRTPEERLAAIEAELAEGWSYPAYDRLREMADHGNAGAQYRLGQLYEQAEGVIQNLADAVHWYTVAAEQGHVPSQTRLGLIYFIDPPSAATLTAEEYESVARGQLPSGTMLEKLFPHGFSVAKDFARAAKWNRLAAASGVAEAQARYGHQLALGLGVERDVADQRTWRLLPAMSVGFELVKVQRPRRRADHVICRIGGQREGHLLLTRHERHAGVRETRRRRAEHVVDDVCVGQEQHRQDRISRRSQREELLRGRLLLFLDALPGAADIRQELGWHSVIGHMVPKRR